MQRQAVFARATWLALSLLLAATPAFAQTGPDTDAEPDVDAQGAPDPAEAMGGLDEGLDGSGALAAGDRPWAEGVSPEDQAAATKIFKEGNALLRDSLFAPAVAKYREALQRWDHPGIHYNLSLALLNMDQPIEVYQSLQKAMQYGAAPLDEDKFERAKSYLVLIEKQLARVEIVCDQPDASVSMDGRPLFTGPGRYEGIVRVGEHTVVASKKGYLTESQQLVLSPGESAEVKFELYTVGEMTISKRRWPGWQPWAMAGAGTAVVLLGGSLHWRSGINFTEFDTEFDKACPNLGCPEDSIPDELDSQLTRARWQQRIAVTSYVVGGAALVSGMVMVFLNRPQLFRKDDPSERVDVALVPILSPDAAGVSAAYRF